MGTGNEIPYIVFEKNIFLSISLSFSFHQKQIFNLIQGVQKLTCFRDNKEYFYREQTRKLAEYKMLCYVVEKNDSLYFVSIFFHSLKQGILKLTCNISAANYVTKIKNQDISKTNKG